MIILRCHMPKEDLKRVQKMSTPQELAFRLDLEEKFALGHWSPVCIECRWSSAEA